MSTVAVLAKGDDLSRLLVAKNPARKVSDPVRIYASETYASPSHADIVARAAELDVAAYHRVEPYDRSDGVLWYPLRPEQLAERLRIAAESVAAVPFVLDRPALAATMARIRVDVLRLSAEATALIAGVSRTQVYRWEAGLIEPPLSAVLKIGATASSMGAGIDLAELLSLVKAGDL